MATRGPTREHTGISLAIAAMIVTFLVFVPALLVVSIYTYLTVYAVVKGVGSAPESASPLTVLFGVVAFVTAFTLLLAGTVSLAGRAMNPKRRDGD